LNEEKQKVCCRWEWLTKLTWVEGVAGSQTNGAWCDWRRNGGFKAELKA